MLSCIGARPDELDPGSFGGVMGELHGAGGEHGDGDEIETRSGDGRSISLKAELHCPTLEPKHLR